MSKIGIVGTGLIGKDLAALFLGYENQVTMYGLSEHLLAEGSAGVLQDYNALIEQNLLTEEERDHYMAGLSLTASYDDLSDCSFIFEAVVEKLDVKRAVFASLEKACPRDTIFISVTSGITADNLAQDLIHRERMLVGHPWNPPHLIPLVEVVRSEYTSDEVLTRTLRLLESMDRQVVVLKKAVPGFIGNRLQHAMYREALSLIEQGVATPADIDKTVYYSFGQRFSSVGLMEYYDSCGLQLQYDVQSYLLAELSNASAPQKPLTDCLDAGLLGPKTGQGLYHWDEQHLADFSARKCRPFYPYLTWKKHSDQ